MKTIMTLAALVVSASIATQAKASGAGETSHEGTVHLEDGAMSYELFEQAVEHVDLENCPAEFDSDKVFCRMTLASEMANVFVFSFDGDQNLVAVKSYELDDGFLSF